MAGGIITPSFAASVSNNGCLGSIAAGGLSIETLTQQIKEVQVLTSHPYAVNIFAHPRISDLSYDMKTVNAALNEIRKILNIPQVTDVALIEEPSVEEYVELCIQLHVPVVSFTFGCPDKHLVALLKDAGIKVIGTATNVAEALMIEDHCMDFVIAQGYEAGGHQGGFLKKPPIGLMSLIPQVVDAVNIPVIAAGGISDRRGIKAAAALGADYVQIGTRFLNTYESNAHPLHKESINQAAETSAVLTAAFTGKQARGIENKMMQLMTYHSIPPYPIMNQLTADIRAAAKAQNNAEFMSNWAGQNIRTAQTVSLHTLLNELTTDR